MADSTGSSSASLPVVTAPLTDTALVGAAFTSDQTLAVITGDGLIEPIQTLPSITGDGAALSGSVGASAQSLSILTGDGTSAAAPALSSSESLPLIAADGSALVQRLADSALSLPIADATGEAILQRLATSAQSLPTIQPDSTATTQDPAAVYSDQTLPALSGDGAFLSGRFADSDQTLAPVTGEATAYVTLQANSGQTLPVWQADGSGVTSRLATSTLTLPVVTGDGSTLGSITAASDLELPMWQGDGTAASLSLSSVVTLPVWIAYGVATTNDAPAAGQAAQQGQAWALNTQTRALAQDTNNRFNSYAVRGSVVLAANEDGLYLLGGATDAGTVIDTHMTLPISDLGESRLKRMGQMTLGYKADGQMTLTVLTDDGSQYAYTLTAVSGAKCQPNRVKIGKGMKSRYWEIKLENVAGADHAIDKLDIDWEILSRRVP